MPEFPADLPEFECLRLSYDDRVLTAVLDRPQARNAINEVLRREIRTLLTSLTGRRDIGALVLTGAGEAFCAGGDFSMMQSFLDADWRDQARNLENGLLTLRDLLSVQQPVIAAVNGAATGLGATLALASDLIVMAETATLADTHVRVGIVAGDGGTLLWPAAMGTAKAKQYLMTGQKMTAAEAERLGVVNEVAPRGDVVKRAQQLAHELAHGPRFAIEWTKHAINTRLLRDLYEQLPLSLALEAATFAQPDITEGITAFRAKRQPAWPSVTTGQTSRDGEPDA
jgi:enoyl-CoA hydratase/carnithine racemase